MAPIFTGSKFGFGSGGGGGAGMGESGSPLNYRGGSGGSGIVIIAYPS